MRGEVVPGGQREPCTGFTCEQCGAAFTPKNRNGIRPRFCRLHCSTAWHNRQRLNGAAALKAKRVKKNRRADPGKQRIDLAVIPPLERAAWLRDAAERLGLTEGDVLRATRRGQPQALGLEVGA